MKWVRGLETETVLGIDESEIKILQSVLKQSVSRLRRQYEKYRNLRDGGKATQIGRASCRERV